MSSGFISCCSLRWFPIADPLCSSIRWCTRADTCRHLHRQLWLVLLLFPGGYSIFTDYRVFNKYYNRPISTVLSRKHLKEIDLPAVTICSLNLFTKSKILMTDDNPLFATSGLNISSWSVTAPVRGNWPCGLSLLCCYPRSD